MKIIVIAGRYGISGVPLAQLRFARALAKRGNQVELIFGMLNDQHEAPSVEGVTVRILGKARVSQMILPLAGHFREYKPDLVFPAGDHLNVMVIIAALLSRTKAKISCSSRVTPFDTYSDVLMSKGWILKQMMRMTMWRADVLTCVSVDMVEQYKTLFKKSSFVSVYNIIDDECSRQRMKAPIDDDWFDDTDDAIIVAAGSLVPWKGFSELIVAMSKVVKKKRARLIILGEGPMRNELENMISEYGLEGVIRLRGNVDNPLSYFSRSNVFVLSSHVEGLPNVLVEAMLCGCTPVSTNCPTGPREVLQDGKYGYLVPMRDPLALADAISRAIDYPVPKEKLLEAIEPFREENVIRRHFDLLGVKCA